MCKPLFRANYAICLPETGVRSGLSDVIIGPGGPPPAALAFAQPLLWANSLPTSRLARVQSWYLNHWSFGPEQSFITSSPANAHSLFIFKHHFF